MINLDAGKLQPVLYRLPTEEPEEALVVGRFCIPAGPDSISAPSFRALTAADIPALNLSKVAGTLPSLRWHGIVCYTTGWSTTDRQWNWFLPFNFKSVVGGLTISNTAGSIIWEQPEILERKV